MKTDEAIEVITDAIDTLPFLIPGYLTNFVKEEIFRSILKDREQIKNLIKGLK